MAANYQELRGALVDVLAPSQVDPSRPQELARALGIDKTLAWKVSKIVRSREPAVAVQHLPGSTAFAILLSAAERAGATQGSIARARTAIESFDSMVSRQLGDRPTLELVLDSLPEPSRDRLSLSRKLAFRGNSGIWGVQAKTRVNLAIIAPSDRDPDLIDIVNVGGWVDFRRLRAESRWALFRVQVFDTKDPTASSSSAPQGMPLDPTESADGPMLMRDFCSPSLPPIRAVPDQNGDIVYELGTSSIGNSGAFSCFYGSRIKEIGSRWARDEDDCGEFAATISAPVESLQFDLLVHRNCGFPVTVSTQVYGVLNLTPATRHDRDLIPVELTRTDLGSYPPVVDTPLVPRYTQIIDHAMARCKWSRQDFVGVRLKLEYPPYPSTVVVKHPLATRERV